MTRVKLSAIIGTTLVALLLNCSIRDGTRLPSKEQARNSAEIVRLNARGKKLFAQAKYQEARQAFLSAAAAAERNGDYRSEALNLNNAGGCSVATTQFGLAMKDFLLAKRTAQSVARRNASSQSGGVAPVPLLATLNNLASLYIQMGQPENAVRIAGEALTSPAADADHDTHAKLLCQLAMARMQLGQFDQAEPIYRQAIRELMDQNDLDAAARAWGALGSDSLAVGHLEEAEWALSEGLRLVRIHRLNASAGILSGLAKLESRKGRISAAKALFASALAAPPNLTPRWIIYAERGRFRSDSGDFAGALDDFRVARLIAGRMRADVVPADQDRVALEGGLNLVMQGLVDAGNRLACEHRNHAVLQETFDAAEQDRLWSLRALVPSPNDWRSRLPDHYWEVLAQYQSLERVPEEKRTPEIANRAAQWQGELQEIEASVTSGRDEARIAASSAKSALGHVRRILNDDSVLLSFLISETGSWVWAVDQQRVDVYPLPPGRKIRAEVTAFSRAIREGTAVATVGKEIYRDLFGGIAATYLRHRRWLLELDGPLYELPFAALVTGEKNRAPTYLIERAALQSIPSSLMLELGTMRAGGGFLGIGDPIYNTADPRYQGRRIKVALALPRLPNTDNELSACARAWNSRETRLLTGAGARPEELRAAMMNHPAIIHFATHVVAAQGQFRSGLIALSLDPAGLGSFLGPMEIVARPVAASLVVVNGCHSEQGEVLPSSGLMGLTRAWIGAGAKAVMSTQWDVPDDAAESLMATFYSALKADPQHSAAFALRQAQLSELQKERASVAKWAGYSLLSRSL